MRKLIRKGNPFSKYTHYHGHLVHEPIDWRQKWLRREADFRPKNGSPYPLGYLNPPLLRSAFGEYSCRTHISSHFLRIQRGLSTYLFPRASCCRFPHHVLSKSLTIQTNLLFSCYHPWIGWFITTCMAVSPSKRIEQPGVLLRFQPWEDFPSSYSSGMSQRGPRML